MVQSILRKNKSLYLTERNVFICFLLKTMSYIQWHQYSLVTAEYVVRFFGPVCLGFDHKKFYSVAFLSMSIFISKKCYKFQHHFSQYDKALVSK